MLRRSVLLGALGSAGLAGIGVGEAEAAEPGPGPLSAEIELEAGHIASRRRGDATSGTMSIPKGNSCRAA